MCDSNWDWKFNIQIPRYSHLKSDNISKQINDKERESAAMENFGIRFVIKKSYQNILNYKTIF